MEDMVIQASSLTRVFNGSLVAVDHVSFDVAEGETFGFLGPNGAGKTTTIKLLTTVLRPTAGRAAVAGHDVVRDPAGVRRSIGLVPQEYTADEDLTGLENLLLCGRLYKLPRKEAGARAGELLDLVQLRDVCDRRAETYSGGMRRRLELACGLIHRPRVLFLDEPTLGLDVQTRVAVWEYIRRLKGEYGMTLFLTTHYLEEADRMCDRIAIIDHGRIVAMDAPAALKASLGGDVVEVRAEDTPQDRLLTVVAAIPDVRDARPIEGGVRLKVSNGGAAAPGILEAIRAAGIKPTGISLSSPTLDQVYLEHTGRSLRDAEADPGDAFRRRITLEGARP